MIREVQYTAPQGVLDAIASLGRTEDVCFSPSERRLAVVSFRRHRITVFDIDIARVAGGTQIALTGGVEVSSTALQLPHGVDFIDDDTLIVTSRGSDVALFKLPHGEEEVCAHELLPVTRWSANDATLLNAPGSVAVTRVEESVCEILICNNDGHTITRHVFDRDAGALRTSEILLQRHLDVPDGVSLSADRRWIAVSNHGTHNVFLYENSPALNCEAKPDGILRGVHYPHGLRFSADGRHLLVADAGAPFLHVYAQDSVEWRGVRNPIATIRIMDDAVFGRGRHNREEGGAKGLDLGPSSNVLVVTSECQPLAFFDVAALLEQAATSPNERAAVAIESEISLMREARTIMAEKAAEIDSLQQSLTNLRNSVADLKNGISWRITAPLRRLKSIFHPPT